MEAFVTDGAPGNNTVPRLLFYNGYAYDMPSATHCNFVGDDCFIVRTHPKIDSLSHNSGYTGGGQILTVMGHGLNGTDITVVVDGVTCLVQFASNDKITCETGLAESESLSGYMPG